MVATGRMFLIVLPFVFLAALVDSISGGGGLISLPAYTMAGLNYDYASGNNKFSSTFGTLVATIRYYRSGRIRIRPALCAIAGSLPCSYLGTMAAIRLGDGFMRVFMLIAAPAAGAIVALRRPGSGKAREQTRRDYGLCALIRNGHGDRVRDGETGEPRQQRLRADYAHCGRLRVLFAGDSGGNLLDGGQLDRLAARDEARRAAGAICNARGARHNDRQNRGGADSWKIIPSRRD